MQDIHEDSGLWLGPGRLPLGILNLCCIPCISWIYLDRFGHIFHLYKYTYTSIYMCIYSDTFLGSAWVSVELSLAGVRGHLKSDISTRINERHPHTESETIVSISCTLLSIEADRCYADIYQNK